MRRAMVGMRRRFGQSARRRLVVVVRAGAYVEPRDLVRGKRGASGQMHVGKLHGKQSAREESRLRALRGVVALFVALVVSFAIPAIASANISFVKAYGWGVLDDANQFETCTTTCEEGFSGAGAGEFQTPNDVATNSSGDVYVADNENSRIDEFSAAGAFMKAYGW